MSTITTTHASNGKDLATLLRLLRQEADLTLEEVAKQAGMSYYRLSRIERSRNGARLTLEELCRLIAVFERCRLVIEVGEAKP